MKETIVISGPMTGLPGYNLDAFYAAERALKDLGFRVYNPAYAGEKALKKHGKVELATAPYHELLRDCISKIMESDSICLLPGWENSNGARQELAAAIDCSKKVYLYSDLVSTQAVFDWFKHDEDKINTINDLCRDANINAVNHGWWEEERSFGEIVALMHSELSEALEWARKDPEAKSNHITDFLGIEEEFADVLIRIFDYCGKKNYRLGEAVIAKMKFNLERPKKHGKRF